MATALACHFFFKATLQRVSQENGSLSLLPLLPAAVSFYPPGPPAPASERHKVNHGWISLR